MKQAQILIVDDEPDIRELLEITLNRMGLATHSVANLTDALDLIEKQQFSLCLTDMNLPDGSGLSLVSHIQETQPELPVAVITAYGNVDTAITALKSGAFDFVSKPIELERLRGLIDTALKIPSRENQIEISDEVRLLGDSAAANKLRLQIKKLSRSQAPVYISGESGSGKELVARLIHANGPRSEMPFIAVNCGAIPSELMESEFFGHVKGSFTGAVSDKQGLFQSAQGGTLFLDEIADLPLDMQVKLLRSIQEKSVRSVGDNKEVNIDVRILSATHKNLEDEVRHSRFRQDLYYRVNVIELAVPPLRSRSEDVRVIGEQVLAGLNKDTEYTLTDIAWSKLESYRFPGNVRELQNILERACALSERSVLEAEDLGLENVVPEQIDTDQKTSPPQAVDATGPVKSPLYPAIDLNVEFESMDIYLQEIERQLIERALEETRWNKTAAAERLGISFRALRYKLEKLDIR
ncbi:MAG: sigma-54-dependent transcriptional regulator [Pseudomonadales bacterium]